MKKHLLSLAIMLFSIAVWSNSASALNAYAYGLTGKLSDDKTEIVTQYSLNGDIISGNITFSDGTDIVKTVPLANDQLTKGTHAVNVPIEGLPTGKSLSWKVTVVGGVVGTPTVGETTYKFNHPQGVDVDVNPESPYFGRSYVTECMEPGATHLGYTPNKGKGLYAFDAALQTINNKDNTLGFTGDLTYEVKNAESKTAYDPRKVRISADGRIFITRQGSTCTSLYEVNPADLNAPFTEVFKGTVNENYETCNGEKWIAGQNVGFDVKGAGKDLKLLLLSANKLGLGFDYSGFKTAEYNLGEGTSWSDEPSNIVAGLTGKYTIQGNNANVAYDNEGGIWYCQYRANPSAEQPSLIHINADGIEDYKDITTICAGAAIRFNHDFSLLAIANKKGGVGVYAISKDAEGKPVLTEKYSFDTTIGNNCNDIAWDYADNMYIVGNSGEWFKVFAMPRTDGTVTTPVAVKYNVTLEKETPHVYLLGMVEGTDYTWDSNKGAELALNEDGTYEITTQVGQETGLPNFGITTKLGSTWDAISAYRLSPNVSADTKVESGKTYPLVQSEKACEVAKAGEYKVVIDLAKMTVTATLVSSPVETFDYNLVRLNKFTTNLPATNEARQATVANGNLYLQDKSNTHVEVWNKNGKTDKTLANSGSTTNITSDEAGNVVTSQTGWASKLTTDGTFKINVFPADGTEMKTVSVDVSDYISEIPRLDFFSQIKGNILSDEGGVFVIPIPNTFQAVSVTIANGEQDSDATTMITYSNATQIADNGTIAYKADLSDGQSAVVFNKRNAGNSISIMNLDSDNNPLTDTEAALATPNHNACNGSCIFTLNGKDYIVYPSGANYLDGFSIAEVSTNAENQELANHAAELTANPNVIQCNWLFAVPVSDTRAIIYQYVPGAYISLYEFNTQENTYPEKLYVAGNLSTSVWNPSDDTATLELLDGSVGQYKGTITLVEAGSSEAPTGYGYFAISANCGDWEIFNAARYGAEKDGDIIATGDNKLVVSQNAYQAPVGTYSVLADLPFSTIALTKTTGTTTILTDRNVTITTGFGEISIDGDYTNVDVYTTGGALVGKNQAHINCAAGIYLVRVDGKVTKVVVK